MNTGRHTWFDDCQTRCRAEFHAVVCALEYVISKVLGANIQLFFCVLHAQMLLLQLNPTLLQNSVNSQLESGCSGGGVEVSIWVKCTLFARACFQRCLLPFSLLTPCFTTITTCVCYHSVEYYFYWWQQELCATLLSDELHLPHNVCVIRLCVMCCWHVIDESFECIFDSMLFSEVDHTVILLY
jgi:hypothetical protein